MEIGIAHTIWGESYDGHSLHTLSTSTHPHWGRFCSFPPSLNQECSILKTVPFDLLTWVSWKFGKWVLAWGWGRTSVFEMVLSTLLHFVLGIYAKWSSSIGDLEKPKHCSTLKSTKDDLCPAATNTHPRFKSLCKINKHAHRINMKVCFLLSQMVKLHAQQWIILK